MRRIDLAPTKSNLRKVKSELEFVYEGFDLLNQKREILVMEIVKNIKKIREIESRMESLLDEFYDAYKKSAAESGSGTIAMKSFSEKRNYTLDKDSYRIMGITIPVISMQHGDIVLNSSIQNTGLNYDIIKMKSIPLMKLLVNYASLARSVFLLSNELKKVQRRVNALEKIFIPAYEDTKKYITDRLEEIDREEIFIKKLIGSKRG